MNPRFVDGLLFDHDLTHVVLIRKTKPSWQAGKLNCVGGKIEPGETPHDAVVREFEEEAGLIVPSWKPFLDLKLTRDDGELYCFYAITSAADLSTVISKTEEKVGVYSIDDIMRHRTDTIPNLRWLIQMALSFEFGEPVAKFVAQEVAEASISTVSSQ